MSSFYGGDHKPKSDYERLASCGRETRIYRQARLAGAGRIHVGRGCRIDDFAFLAGGEGVRLEDRVHVASYSSISGGGTALMASFSGLAAGCRLVTGSEKHMGEGLTNPCVPDEFRAVERSHVTLRKHALLFTNVVVLPGVEIGAGCVVGAGAVVSRDLDPWGVYLPKRGSLMRVNDRPRERILQMEAQCVEKYGY
jgi:galactoside O-acetyltransferase